MPHEDRINLAGRTRSRHLVAIPSPAQKPGRGHKEIAARGTASTAVGMIPSLGAYLGEEL